MIQLFLFMIYVPVIIICCFLVGFITISRTKSSYNRPPASVADHVVRLLNNGPDGWKVDAYTATHLNTGTSLWISNGVDHVYIRSKENGATTCEFNRYERKRIWRAFQSMKEAINERQTKVLIERLANNV